MENILFLGLSESAGVLHAPIAARIGGGGDFGPVPDGPKILTFFRHPNIIRWGKNFCAQLHR